MEHPMRTKQILIPVLLAAMVANAPGFAQDRDHGGDRDGRWSQNDRDRGGDRNDNRNDNRRDDRNGGYRNDHNDGRRDGYQARGPGGDRHWDGAGPNHDFRRGDRLPSSYRNRQYVVDDWRGHHLRQPPRGYHWVQTGGDYVLAAVATGIIADLIINH
jgi:Ni/Co efflux regulator RcnB